MIFEQIATGGCQSYLVGCSETCAAVLIDPEIRQMERYRALIARDGLRLHYVIDTHTHADHFSATKQMGEMLHIPVVMHQDHGASPAVCQAAIAASRRATITSARTRRSTCA